MILFSSNTTGEINCKNQLLEDIQKKSEQSQLSFRQISHLDPNVDNGFTFFLAIIIH